MNYHKNIKRIQAANNIRDVAYILRIKPSLLSYHLYIVGAAKDTKKIDKYVEFTIPKKSGGLRTISAPNKGLKVIQRNLSDFLYSCVEETHKKRKTQDNLSYGYRKGVSNLNNAKRHSNKKFVFNIDLKDFFDSINFGRVRGFFISNNNFKLKPKIATILAQIACHENSLPQGSPCSPIISNLITHILDIKLAKMAYNNGCSYSRYCDDITFSTNKKVFPHDIAFTYDGEKYFPSKKLINIIEKNGFEINHQKVRMSYYYSQQAVTGLTVNKKVNTPRLYRDTVRALVHNLCTKGDFNFKESFRKDKISDCVIDADNKKLNSLQGMLSYIHRVDKEFVSQKTNSKKCKSNVESLSKNEKVFRNYVLYRYFFNPQEVTIFGEGKTDKVHLRNYLKFRKIDYNSHPPEIDTWNQYTIKNFESNLFDTISISGGTGDITKLIKSYSSLCSDFYKNKKQNPIILLLDNDKGSKDVKNLIKNFDKKSENFCLENFNSKPFHYIAHNMYVIFLPDPTDQYKGDVDIESFYSKDIIDTSLDGKFFEKSSKAKNVNKDNIYSKWIFASKIIPDNHSKVDWLVFDKIFHRIQSAVEDFNNKKI